MKKIVISTIIFLATASFLGAQDPVGSNASNKAFPSAPTTYSAEKPSSPSPSASARMGAAKKGVPASAKFLMVDASELYAKYNKAIEAREKFAQAEENARKEMNDMIQEGIKLGESFKELQAKVGNPSLSEEAKNKYIDEANVKIKLIEEKQMQVAQYKQQAEQTLQQRQQSVTSLHLSDMKEVCAKIAKEKGANLVLNSTGISVMYHDGSADITEEAIEVLNATKK